MWYSTVGEIEIEEETLRLRAGGIRRPFRQFHRIAHRTASRRLQRVIVDFGAEHSFVEASQRIEEHYGIKLSPSTVRSVSLCHARRAELFWASYDLARKHMPSAPDCIISEIDGCMLPIVKTSKEQSPSDARKTRQTEWKEIRLCAAQIKGEVTAKYSISLDCGPLHAGLEWRKVVDFSGGTEKTRIHGVGDGAPWIASEFDRQFGLQGAYLIDFFHVSEYLAEAAVHCCPQHPNLWRHNQQELLKSGNLTQVLQNLEQIVDPPEPVLKAIGYLRDRKQHLDYKNAIANDLPIGSGLIESGHRHVLQRRLKTPGAWWLLDSARAMATLRIVRKNSLWNEFWAA